MRKLLLLFVFSLMCSAAFAESIDVVNKIGGFRNSQACGIHNGVVYIIDYYYIISYSPTSGAILDTLNFGEYVRNLDFKDNTAVVIGIANVYLIDISNPSAMIELYRIPHGGTSGWDVDVSGDYAFIALQSHLGIYRIFGSTLASVGSFIPPSAFPMARSIAVAGNTAYAGLGNSGIAALDISTPSSPSLLMSADTPGNTLDLKIAGDVLVCCDGAYVGSDTTSVRFFGIPSPTTLSPLGSWIAPTNSDARGSFVVGNRLALADGEGGIRVIDFSTPSSPVQVVHRDFPIDITDVCVSGTDMFATGRDTFYIMTTDAFEPDTGSEPIRITGVQPSHGLLTACAPIVEFAFTAGSESIDNSSLQISALGRTFRASDSEVSITASSISLDLSGSAIAPLDTICAVLDSLADATGTPAINLGISTCFLYDAFAPLPAVSYGHAGDVLHPDSISISGTIRDIGHAGFVEDSFKVVVRGISYGTSGAYLDFDPPNFTCRPMGTFNNGDVVDVCIRAIDAVSAANCGPNRLDSCWTFRVSSEGIDEIASLPKNLSISAWPSPFNSSVNIALSPPGVGASNARYEATEIEIFDIHGRLVTGRLVTNSAEALLGPTPTVWHPDESLPSGVYLIRARLGDLSAEARVIYLK